VLVVVVGSRSGSIVVVVVVLGHRRKRLQLLRHRSSQVVHAKYVVGRAPG
jgi:hypothetical protein